MGDVEGSGKYSYIAARYLKGCKSGIFLLFVIYLNVVAKILWEIQIYFKYREWAFLWEFMRKSGEKTADVMA